MELLEEEKVGELFAYLETYRNSLSEDGEIGDAEELIRYYRNNENGLLPYQSQVPELPEHPEGLEYRGMGTMENHVWSVIARRMKHNHTSWSISLPGGFVSILLFFGQYQKNDMPVPSGLNLLILLASDCHFCHTKYNSY